MALAQRVGKLAEVRFEPPLDLDELTHFMAEIRNLVQAAPEPLVFCCDWRTVDAFPQTMADTIVWIMRRDNPRIAGNGVLVRRPSLFTQVEQMLRDAQNPRRRVFRDADELRAWLDPQLTPEERARRDAFLAERGTRPPSEPPHPI